MVFLLLRIGVYLLLTVSQNFQQVQDCILQIQKRRQEILHPLYLESRLAFFDNMPNNEQVTIPGVTHDLGRMTKPIFSIQK